MPDPVEPSARQAARVRQAVIAKATRLHVLPSAPFGLVEGTSDVGPAGVRRDFQTDEQLYGLRYLNLDLTNIEPVTADEVIRVGFNADPADFNADRIADIELAIEGAWHWIEDALNGVGIA